MDHNKPEQTLFNAGLAKLQRIHVLRGICHQSRIMHDWDSWRSALHSWRAEINEKLDSQERKKANYFRYATDQCLNKCLINEAHRWTQGDYDTLYDYELFLCDMESKYGFSMPSKAPDSDASKV